MIISRVKLKNWRNFTDVDVQLGYRVFIVGPNASGKSNFLDVFRFLRDIAADGGGLQSAVDSRGGLSKIRCLAARRHSDVEIEVHFSERQNGEADWRYAIGLKQWARGYRKPYLSYEKVWCGDELKLERPDKADEDDELRKTQTHLEQLSANQEFRVIAEAFRRTRYLHIIPQLVRAPEAFGRAEVSGDPFGSDFIGQVADTRKDVQKSRLRKIDEALRSAVPQLKNLKIEKDDRGIPHLQAVCDHWRLKGAFQWEDQFSDGTLRLIGLLWALLEGESLLLMEEPELSLNAEIVSRIPAMMHRILRARGRQVILSTHSADLLSDKSIGGEETLLLIPSAEGTTVRLASSITEVKELLESGMSIAEAALPKTIPRNINQLDLFR